MRDFAEQRALMVERQLRHRGIQDERVLTAMAQVPRELFVPEAERARAYDDSALPIGEGQTISQPLMVAMICQALELQGTERLLEVGTGSGYSAALLAHLAGTVITIERHPKLAEQAKAVLDNPHTLNVEVIVGDGSAGVPDYAPYDAIAVHATGPAPPATLLDQLADPGGRLVIPLAVDGGDMLTLFRRLGEEEFERTSLGPCRFVPLVGQEGFEPESD